jgi:hypothetical protein
MRRESEPYAHDEDNPCSKSGRLYCSAKWLAEALLRGPALSSPAGGALQEIIKWGNLVYLSKGPVLLIRAEEQRVLFGFWRGKQLRGIEPRLKPSGKYDMATLELVERTPLDRDMVIALVTEAISLNASLGDPTLLPD